MTNPVGSPATVVAGPRRIAFCITDLDPGGAERALVQLVTRLNRDDWEPAVYCLGPAGELAATLRNRGIPVTCYEARGIGSGLRVLFRLRRDLSRFSPQLLQTFLFHGNLMGRLAGRLAGVPIIVAGQRVAEREKRWHLRLERMTRFLVTHHVCVSRGVARHLKEHCSVPPEQISIIPNGVELPPPIKDRVSVRQALGLPAEARVVLAVGRLHPQKGFLTLIDAFAAALPDLPPETRLVIAGEGPQRGTLEKRISRQGLAGRVILTGYREDVPDLLRGADLYVLSSLWEGLPNALLEALAADVPVVATRVEGIEELLPDASPEVVVTPGSVEELSRALRRRMAETDLSEARDGDSQQIDVKCFTWDRVMQNHVGLYGELLSRQSSLNG